MGVESHGARDGVGHSRFASGARTNERGGELRIEDQHGQFIDSDTIKGPKHTESKARDRK